MLFARSAWKMTLLAGACAVVGYFLLQGALAKDIAYSAIGLASAGCVLGGIRSHRPADHRAWYAITIGVLAFVVGDGVYDLYQFVLHRAVPFPSMADAFYLSGYPFLIVGVARLTRGRGREGSAREGYADAGIVAIGALALSWHFLIGAYAHDSSLGIFGRFVTMSYPVLDLAVFFIVIQGLLFRTVRRSFHTLLAAAMLAMIVTDLVYDILVLHGAYVAGGPVDAGWLISYVLIGAAALHPAMASADRSDATSGLTSARRDDSRRRLPIVASAGFVSPTILVVAAVVGSPADVAALALMSIGLFGLVMMRMHWMFDRIGTQTRSLKQSLYVRDSLEGELRHQAFHDSLTGLANRALLQDRVEHALVAAPRARGTVAVCYCDLDGFKTVNDSVGHLGGDAMLIASGKRLAEVVRPGDTVARLGGDEFAVLLTSVEDPAAASAVAERIVAALRRPVEFQGHHIALSVSVGVAVAGTATTAEQLLSQADSAMYEAKGSGKDRFAIFEESMHARILERLELINAFNGALRRHEFLLDYQPQFSLKTGKLEGFEALIRWQHPTLGLVSPHRFIALAEETGYIVPIGRWVMETACHQAGRWSTPGALPLCISVNLSGRQLQDPNFVNDVRTVLALCGLAAGRLTLEITESMLIVDTERTQSVLAELKMLGVRLAIDDFGTGYSSLNYLRRFPVDELKIDKSFVDPLANSTAEGVAFITTIVGLARSLGLLTVAEGVEDAGQRDQLTRLGCDSAQGFLLAGPLDGDAATEFVATETLRLAAEALRQAGGTTEVKQAS